MKNQTENIAVATPVTQTEEVVVITGEPTGDESVNMRPLEGGSELTQGLNMDHRPYSVQWKDGLCDCMDQCAPSCCMATWFPCILLGQIQQKFHERSCAQTVVFFTAAYIMYYLLAAFDRPAASMVSCMTSLLMFACVCKTRGAVRRQLNIEGNEVNDCCASFFCTCCSLAQMARQVYNYRGAWEGCPCNETGDIIMV